jgi:hypothetical protein
MLPIVEKHPVSGLEQRLAESGKRTDLLGEGKGRIPDLDEVVDRNDPDRKHLFG